jgi:hypothetical protein
MLQFVTASHGWALQLPTLHYECSGLASFLHPTTFTRPAAGAVILTLTTAGAGGAVTAVRVVTQILEAIHPAHSLVVLLVGFFAILTHALVDEYQQKVRQLAFFAAVVASASPHGVECFGSEFFIDMQHVNLLVSAQSAHEYIIA